MTIFTIGYGGRTREGFLDALKKHGVACVVDVRIRPDRASMGIFKRARTPDKGVEAVLAAASVFEDVHLTQAPPRRPSGNSQNHRGPDLLLAPGLRPAGRSQPAPAQEEQPLPAGS